MNKLKKQHNSCVASVIHDQTSKQSSKQQEVKMKNIENEGEQEYTQ